MGVLIDTSVWSLALRRKRNAETPVVSALTRLLEAQSISMLGLVRMELLSSLPTPDHFNELKMVLRNYPDLPLDEDDYELAAEYRTSCRTKGVQGSLADFLICAAANRRHMQIFTLDKDFLAFANHIPVDLYLPDLIGQ